jgi:CRP/FNR family transcriptional regulator
MPILNLSENCEKCTANWNKFCLLTPDELKIINDNRYEAAFRSGEIMSKQGSPANHALLMANGLAKIYIEGNNRKNFMIGIGQPGNIIMSPGAWINSRHSFTVAAITPVKACFVSIDVLKKLAKNNGSFAESMLMDLNDKFFQAHQRMVSQAQKRMSGRLAEILLYFSNEVFGSDDYEMILSRQELGEMAGMAKECVVRILREMEDSGIVYSDSSRIKILMKDKLIMISEKG